MKNSTTIGYASLLTLVSLFTNVANAQTPYKIVATGLKSPVGLEVNAQNQLLLTQAGSGDNDGSVSILNANGTTLPIVTGLPSFFNTAAQEIAGPWHTKILSSNQLAIAQGEGTNPYSGSVLVFDLNSFTPGVTAAMTPANNTRQVAVTNFLHSDGFTSSNPYSVETDAFNNLYVSDAAANAIVRFSTDNVGGVVATLPDFANPTPVGPPAINQVPTKILARPEGGYYLSTLTGFPFIEGASTIYVVTDNGTVTPYKTGLSVISDLALDPVTGDLFALQLGQFQLAPTPGFALNSSKITRIRSNGTTEVIAQGFGPASGMAIDHDGNIYVSETFAGRVLKFTLGYDIIVSVDMAGQTVSPKGVHIAHDLDGDWKPNAVRMTHVSGSVYRGTMRVKPSSTVHYKFVNGDSWGENESVLADCGVLNTYGFYDRAATVYDKGYELNSVCFNACMACGPREPRRIYEYCPQNQSLIYCENFENLQAGKLVPQTPQWTTYAMAIHNRPLNMVDDNPLVTGFWRGFTNFDGSKALRVHGNLAGTTFNNPLMRLDNPTTGTYQIRFKMYVPANRSALISLDDLAGNTGFTMAFSGDSLYMYKKVNYQTLEEPVLMSEPIAYTHDDWNDVSLTFNAQTKQTQVRWNQTLIVNAVNNLQLGYGWLNFSWLDIIKGNQVEYFIDDIVYQHEDAQLRKKTDLVEATATISPNPANERILVSPNDNTNETWEVRLVNHLGQVVLTQVGRADSPIELVTNNCISGIYMLEFQSEKVRWAKKVMIQH
jgi:hypothetical protein